MALWFQAALLDGGWAEDVRVTHVDGMIIAVEAGVAPAPGDERGGIALPGLCNVHSHAFQRGMAGLAERRAPDAGAGGDSFWTWREVMYRFLARLDPDGVEAIAALAYAEMLESGFTRVGEFHYLHHAPDGSPYDAPAEMAARIAAAASQTGIGLTLLPVFYAHGGFGGAPAGPGQRRFLSDPDSYARLVEGARAAVDPLGDAVVGVAPHSLRAATPEEIALILPLAGGGPVHIHVAEQVREVDDCLARHGARPVQWLLGQTPVDDRWCLVHATHIDAAERRAIAARGAVAGLCPITEANLGDGLFPARAFLEEGGRIAVGSDSSVLIDAVEELRLLEYGQRLAGRARNVLAVGEQLSVGRGLFSATLAGGAQALGVGSARIAPGARLDLVSLDADSPALVGRSGDALLDSWIFAARGGAVDGVWRAGRKLVAGGRHVERPAIVARYRRVLEAALAR